jgi:hypothetical protein
MREGSLLNYFKRTSFSILAFSTLGLAAKPDTILYAPLAGVHQNQALFEPVLFMESTPSSFSSYIGDARNGGSGMVGNILLPLTPAKNGDQNKRANGWAVGAASGYQRDALQANDIFVPGFFYFEGAAGRATTEPWTVAGTGLRGYFEFAFRNQRPSQTPRQQNRLTLVSQTIPDDNYFIVVRIGASSDAQGSGIVTQKPGKLSWAVQTALYAPLKNKQGYATFKLSPYGLCFGSRFYCGLHLQYVNLFKGIRKPNSEFVNHWAMASLFLKYQRSNTMSLGLEIFESYAASPILNKYLTTARNSYSTYPGAKLNFAFGF